MKHAPLSRCALVPLVSLLFISASPLKAAGIIPQARNFFGDLETNTAKRAYVTLALIPVAITLDAMHNGWKGVFSKDIMQQRGFFKKLWNAVKAPFSLEAWKRPFVGSAMPVRSPNPLLTPSRWTRAKSYMAENPVFACAMTLVLANGVYSAYQYYVANAPQQPEDNPADNQAANEILDPALVTPAKSANPAYPPLPPSRTGTQPRPHPSPGSPAEPLRLEVDTQLPPAAFNTAPAGGTPGSTDTPIPNGATILIDGRPATVTHLEKGSHPKTEGYYSYDNGNTVKRVYQGPSQLMASPIKPHQIRLPANEAPRIINVWIGNSPTPCDVYLLTATDRAKFSRPAASSDPEELACSALASLSHTALPETTYVSFDGGETIRRALTNQPGCLKVYAATKSNLISYHGPKA